MKSKFYAEIAHVLKAGGRFYFHDIFRGPNKEEPVYPAPWAEVASLIALETVENVKNTFDAAGLEIEEWVDKVEDSVAAF